ncbi:MAG: hypothetical protein GTO63_16870, partial [Anaerolineae bacterium]|nr:hypothetical protein [Anaerolineae bacterium]NIN96471.1 hypothetical protein [Anaerolineae bacterium]
MKSISDDLKTHIETETTRSCGVAEFPPGAVLPAYVIWPSPGPTHESTMGTINTIEFQTFHIDAVAASVESMQEAQHRLKEALKKVLPGVITGVMGPPAVR